MIVTLSMNPALDITTNAPQVRPTDKIRCRPARYDAGGGGINVARFAHALGASVSAVFPAGGPTSGVITNLVSQAGVSCHRIPVAESTRESFTVNDDAARQQYRFLLPGPNMSFDEQTQCLDMLRTSSSVPVLPKRCWSPSAPRVRCWPHRITLSGSRQFRSTPSAVSARATRWSRRQWWV